MSLWILSISYTFHLLGTVIWLGGLFVLVLVIWPARNEADSAEHRWLDLQKRLVPWINGSLVVLLVTGFYQMTVDEAYSGVFVIDTAWAWAMLAKHIAYVGLSGITLYMQFGLLPQITQLRELAQTRPKAVAVDLAQAGRQERQLLTLNCILGVLILIFTAVMTAL